MQLPALNLKGIGGGFGMSGLGLNLSALPVGKAKDESHFVYLCKPYKQDLTDTEIEDLQCNADEIFGDGTKIIELTKVPQQFVIIPLREESNAIPPLPVIDAACQDAKNIPSLMEDCMAQQSLLTKEIEQIWSKCEEMRVEEKKLLIENAVLDEKIKNAEAELSKVK